LPTGNEIVPAGQTLASGQIRDSNGPMLVASAARAGAEAVEIGIARDTHDELRRMVEQGLAADVLILSGGVSAGKFDLVPGVLAELGVEQVFHKIAMRPGKPLWFGVKRGPDRQCLVFGLPGNPVSSLVCFELFVRPAIAALGGRGFRGLPVERAELTAPCDHTGGRAAYLPAHVTLSAGSAAGCPEVEILPWHGSADVATLAKANALARLPEEKLQLPAGAQVDVLML
jgi:molybdopterin molybdotransferase